jgi:hypothetical protein
MPPRVDTQVCQISTPGHDGLEQHKRIGIIHRAMRFGDIKIAGTSARDRVICNV